jgi:two-component system, cell cycle sensor histidine kinase and response regulator CckA
MASRILIIEDELYEREQLRAAIAELGCEIAGIAKNRTEAEQLTKQNRPDLALVHMDFGAHDEGFTITRELRLEHHLPVVLLGPSSSDEIRQRACLSGCVAYLVEPLRSDELDAAIRIAVNQDLMSFKAFARHSWLTAMFESLSDAVIATDVDGVVRFLNPAAQLLTGWIPLDAIGKPIEEIYPLFNIKTFEAVSECQIHKVLASQLPTGKRRFLLASRGGGEFPLRTLRLLFSTAPRLSVRSRFSPTSRDASQMRRPLPTSRINSGSRSRRPTQHLAEAVRRSRRWRASC